MNEPQDDTDDAVALHGRYANFFRVGCNAFEFLFDFGQLYLGAGDPQVHTRIVTSPTYAKVFSETLQQSLLDYERTHGPLPPNQTGSGE